MTKFNMKTTLLSLAVLVLLSSCGKSKELNTPEPTRPVTPQVVAPPMNTPGTQTTSTMVDSTAANTNPNNDLLPDDGKQVAITGTNTKKDDAKTNDNASAEDKKTSVQDQASRIDFSNQVAIKTGGGSKDLFYTGAGSDGLLEEFKSYGLKVSKEQQQMNANLAKAIAGAKVLKLSSGQMQIDLIVDETINGVGGLKSYRLLGNADSDMMKINLAQASGDLEFQGGFLKCLDTDGSCLNSYTKIKLSGAYTRIIFRNSYANNHFLIQKDITNNAAFDVMKSYIKNASSDSDTNQKIDGLELSSFEVTNGHAAMGAMLTTKDQQMIGLSIPLLVSGKNSEVNVSVMKSSDLSKSYSLPSGLSYSQKLASSITEVKMLNNNGLGQLKLKLTIGSGSVWMITSPVKKAMLSVDEVRQFESKVKNF